MHISGSRLQPICRSLGIDYSEHFSHWEKNRNRRYPDRRVYDGVDVTPDGAEKLNAYLAARAAKEERKREKESAGRARSRQAKTAAFHAVAEIFGEDFQPHPTQQDERSVNSGFYDSAMRYYRFASAAQAQMFSFLREETTGERAAQAKKDATQKKRTERELGKIIAEVNRRWDLEDAREFAEFANTPGRDRVLRTRTACAESFEQKVYMALVAWVRHNHTGYDDKLASAKAAAYAEYLEAKEWGEDRDIKAQLLDDARDTAREAHGRLHQKFTAEAVAWLKDREKSVMTLPTHESTDGQLEAA